MWRTGKTYIIAELSANHCGDYEKAVQLVKEAHKAGADAVKLQTYKPETITLQSDNEHFVINNETLWDGQTLWDLYQTAHTPWEWHKPLQQLAHSLGLDFFSSPFDETAVDFLEELNVPCYKIASFEVCDHLLLKKIASTGKPVIMSTGASDKHEIREAVYLLRKHGVTDLCLLKCTSAYPAKIEDANLAGMKYLKNTYVCDIGLSDHTNGIIVPITAVAMGATVIEKHIKLSDNSGSLDDAFSLTPQRFKEMVDGVRIAESAIGQPIFTNRSHFKRSLFVCKDIKTGEPFTQDHVKSVRPGSGLHTRYWDNVIGSTAKMDLKAGTPLQRNHFVTQNPTPQKDE